MNQQQSVFIQRAMQQLKQVIDSCCKNLDQTSTASAILGRKRIGQHIVVVKVIAEVDRGFSAPLGSHASKLGASPDYSKQTEHHNTQRGSRWHKPVF